MALFSFKASCTSRTVEGPRVQRTRRISSSDAVGFCGGCFMEVDLTTKTFVVSTKIFVDQSSDQWPGIRGQSLCRLTYYWPLVQTPGPYPLLYDRSKFLAMNRTLAGRSPSRRMK